MDAELAQPAESYGTDLSKMVVAVKQPCLVRYRRRAARAVSAKRSRESQDATAERPYCIRVDLDLCQGHAVCVSEAPELFNLNRQDGQDKVVLLSENPAPELRAKVESAVRHCPTRALSIEE